MTVQVGLAVNYITQRLFLSGLVLMPAIACLLVPDALRLQVFDALGVTGTLLLWSLLTALVVHAATRMPAQVERPAYQNEAPVLLRRGVLGSPDLALPGPKTMRETLGVVLSQADMPPPQDGPESADRALGLALGRLIEAWNAPTLHAQSDARLAELFLFYQLLTRRADEAGALAQLFARPDVVLEIRDQIATIRKRRAAFDKQNNAFAATLTAWQEQGEVDRPAALLTALRGLAHPDIDLWHKVVTEHDPHDAAQREAALWCVRQPDCDRATVACFLAYAAADGLLAAAARRGDRAWLSGVQSVVDGWNAGRYTRRELGLSPSDSLSAMAPVFSNALDQVAEATGSTRWATPRGAFAEYTGRKPRPRDHWCLRTGRLLRAPRRTDYFDQGVASAA